MMLKNYLRCNKNDRVLFCGSGATAGANRLVAMLGISAPTPAARRAACTLPPNERPVVFVGPYEHHSNLLPWRDSTAEVIQIREDPNGGPDLRQLEAELVLAAGRPLRVGAFGAASNVTGILTDVDAVTVLLHSHGALAVWDYASAAPYGKMLDMNPPDPDPQRAALMMKDAIFFSPHKFAGGPQVSIPSSSGLFQHRILSTESPPTQSLLPSPLYCPLHPTPRGVGRPCVQEGYFAAWRFLFSGRGHCVLCFCREGRSIPQERRGPRGGNIPL